MYIFILIYIINAIVQTSFVEQTDELYDGFSFQLSREVLREHRQKILST